MITREQIAVIDHFDDMVAGLTYDLHFSEELDFTNPEIRVEYLEMFRDFQYCLGDGEFSYRKVIDTLNEVDSEGKFTIPLSRVDPTVVKVLSLTSNDALYGGKSHEVPITNAEAWERLKAKYVVEKDGKPAIDETVEPTEEDAEYAHQILMTMEVLLPMFNKVGEIYSELSDEMDEIMERIIAEEKRGKQEKQAEDRSEISYEDEKVLERFESAVMELSESLDYANGVDFSDARSKAPFMELYVQLHTCLKHPEHSYLHVVKVLEKIDTEHKFSGFLTAAPFSLSVTMKETSRLLTGATGDGFNDGEAFEYLGKKYFTEVDGELVPNPEAVASPEDTGYAAQVMYMVDALGYSMFGPLTGMARKLMHGS
jgi:hypothetical protein